MVTWGSRSYGGAGFPTAPGFSNDVRSTNNAFTAYRPADGTVVSWGYPSSGGSGFPTGPGFSNDVRSTVSAFTACRPADGTVVSWGDPSRGGSGFPTGPGFSNDVRSTYFAFTACRPADGTVVSWGSPSSHLDPDHRGPDPLAHRLARPAAHHLGSDAGADHAAALRVPAELGPYPEAYSKPNLDPDPCSGGQPHGQPHGRPDRRPDPTRAVPAAGTQRSRRQIRVDDCQAHARRSAAQRQRLRRGVHRLRKRHDTVRRLSWDTYTLHIAMKSLDPHL